MTPTAKITSIIATLKEFLELESTKTQFRVSERDFSRNSGKLDFSKYALLGVSLLKNSLASEVFNILTTNDLAYISKSASSQGRYKISSSFYQKWSELLVESVRSSGLASATWRGYGLEAVDGTSVVLPQTQALAKEFGVHKSHNSAVVMAKYLVRVDLLNKYLLQTEVFATTKHEITILKESLWRLSTQAITLFDRGFANASIFAYMMQHQKPFVCRLKVGFNQVVKDFVASADTDRVVTFITGATETFVNEAVSEGTTPKTVPDTEIKKGTSVSLRLVKIILPTGGIEVLATHLMDSQAITTADLGELYRQRWGVETCIDEMKNQFLCMLYSGLKPEAILQDSYATMFVYNLRRLLMNEAQNRVNEDMKESKRAIHPQQINQNVALGVLKPKIMTLFLTHQPQRIIAELITFFTQNKMPIIKEKKKPERKPSFAKRRNLVIQKNYKKAV